MTVPAMRVPFLYVEFNSERAFQGSPLKTLKTLMVGQKLSTGTMTANTTYLVTSADQAQKLAGVGSQLARMAASWFLNNKITPLTIVGMADAGSAVVATGTLTITGPASAAGVLSFYIGGRAILATVASGDTATTVASAIAAAITADTKCAVSASPSAGVVTLSAKNLGLCGNDIDLRMNYYQGDVTPAGLTTAIVAMASGATNPTIVTVLDAIGDAWYDLIVSPWYDATNLTALEVELDYRFGSTVQIDGYYITARPGSYATLASFGATRNSKYTVVAACQKFPTPPAEVAAAIAAQVAQSASEDPARPFQTLELKGVLPPLESERFITSEYNGLLSTGIATLFSGDSGKVTIQRLVTTYQTNVSGAPDVAYLDLNTPLTLSYLRWSFRNRILNKYPRAKLADSSARIASGQSVMTPELGRAEAISWFMDMESKGILENLEQFKKDLVCVRSTTDVNRMEWTLPPDLVNQFMVGSVQMQFLLQSP